MCVWQAWCGQSGLLTSVRRRSTTPGYEVCCSDFTAEDFFTITCLFRKWVCVAWAQVGGSAISLSIYEKQCRFDKSTRCWLTATDEDQRFAPPAVCPQRSNCAFFCQTSLRPPLFGVSRCHWKKPNVCLLSPILTSSLPPLSPSAPPILAEHARTALHAAVQRQPQRPQPHQLPWLLPWGVLPAADRTD